MFFKKKKKTVAEFFFFFVTSPNTAMLIGRGKKNSETLSPKSDAMEMGY